MQVTVLVLFRIGEAVLALGAQLASPRMGQPVAVENKPGTDAQVVRFETNRSLTGQGHERFASLSQATGERPAAAVARRLFESGQVQAVHVFSNVITAYLNPGASASGLSEIVRDLYQYWKPGMTPPSEEELMAQVEAPAEVAASSSGEGGAVVVDSRVPAHLLERSRLARAKWAAQNG